MKRLLAWIVPARAMRGIGKTRNIDYYVDVLVRADMPAADIYTALIVLAMNEESEW